MNKKIEIIIISFIGLLFLGCATSVKQKRIIELPQTKSEKAWSRAHSYLAQYGGDFFLATDYAIAAEDTIDGKIIMALREEYDEFTRIIVIAEKEDTGNQYFLKTELKQDVESAKSYILRGKTIEFEKEKRMSNKEKMMKGKRGGMKGMRGRQGMGNMGGMRGMNGMGF